MTISEGSPGDSIPEVSSPVPQHIIKHVMETQSTDIEEISRRGTDFMNLGFEIAMKAGASLDTSAMKEVLDSGTKQFVNQSHTFVGELEDAHSELKNLFESNISGENSELKKTSEILLERIEGLLDSMGDNSIEGSLAQNIQYGAAKEIASAVSELRDLLDLGIADSAASKINANLQKSVMPIIEKLAVLEKGQAAQEMQMQEMVDAMASKLLLAFGIKGELDESLKTHPNKGVTFEAEVHESLLETTSQLRDTVEAIGEKTSKNSKSKNGDQLCSVITDAGVNVGDIVVEDKAGQLTLGGENGMEKQLLDAITDNNAVAAIGVYDLEYAPKSVQKSGIVKLQSNIYVVGVDRTEGDFRFLSFLYSIVRLQVIAEYSKSKGANDVDCDTIIDFCDQAVQQLKSVLNVKQTLDKDVSQVLSNASKRLDVFVKSQMVLINSIKNSVNLSIEEDKQ